MVASFHHATEARLSHLQQDERRQWFAPCYTQGATVRIDILHHVKRPMHNGVWAFREAAEIKLQTNTIPNGE